MKPSEDDVLAFVDLLHSPLRWKVALNDLI